MPPLEGPKVTTSAYIKSPWRNWLARSAVNRKVGGSSPPGGDFLYINCILFFQSETSQQKVWSRSRNLSSPPLWNDGRKSGFCLLRCNISQIIKHMSCIVLLNQCTQSYLLLFTLIRLTQECTTRNNFLTLRKGQKDIILPIQLMHLSRK